MKHQPDLHRSIEAAKSLRLELTKILVGDENGEVSEDTLQTIKDTFDGETTLDVEIREAVLMIADDEMWITGIKAHEAQLKARRERLEKRIVATRGLIEQAMHIAEWDQHEMDIGVVSVGKSPPRVEIDEESAIPTQFFKRADPTLDKAGLKKVLTERHKALAAIEHLPPTEHQDAIAKIDSEYPPIPGCHLETGGTMLKIRRS